LALKSDAAAEKPKDQLSRDFVGRSIFDFCNNIDTLQTSSVTLTMSVHLGKADIAAAPAEVRKMTQERHA
jgi:hypothetical protein